MEYDGYNGQVIKQADANLLSISIEPDYPSGRNS